MTAVLALGLDLSFLSDVWSFVRDNCDELVAGLRRTLQVSPIAIAGAFVIGLVLGAARAHRVPVVSQLAAVYVEMIRNTPILVQIFFLYFGLPQGIGPWPGVRLEAFTVAWLSVTIWGGAFNTENFRAGFEAVPVALPRGGLALGFSRLATFLNVTLPIGGRIALPVVDQHVHQRRQEHVADVRHQLPGADDDRAPDPGADAPDGRDVHGARRDLPDPRLDDVRARSGCSSRISRSRRRRDEPPDWVGDVARYMLEEGLRQHAQDRRDRTRRKHDHRVTLGTLLTIQFLPLRALIRLYIEVWRGLPILVTIFIIFFALPAVSLSLRFDALTAGAIALILWGSAQVAEATRGAVQSIPREQHEAASALGFGWVGRHAFVILPQALRRLLPPLVGLLVNIIQNTTIAQVIGAPELLETAERQVERLTAPPPAGIGEIHSFEIYGAVMVIFFCISFPLTRLAAYLEKRLA